MSKTGDSSDDAPEVAVQALACDDPDLQAIRDQIAKTTDPQLRAVLEEYLTHWFQYNHSSAIVG